jgi:hypothetical protein
VTVRLEDGGEPDTRHYPFIGADYARRPLFLRRPPGGAASGKPVLRLDGVVLSLRQPLSARLFDLSQPLLAIALTIGDCLQRGFQAQVG